MNLLDFDFKKQIMKRIYPINSYEAFVLMCLMSDYPLAVYSEVFEKSYEV